MWGALSFEVASIKPHPWTNEGRVGVFVNGDTLIAEHADLYRLVEFAYRLRTDGPQVTGGPGWARMGVLSDVSGAESTLFQVTAKAPAGVHPSIEQFRLMLRALLEERFQLRVRLGKKEMPVFNLVVARGGHRLRENTADIKPALAMRDGRLFRMRATHASMAALVEELSNPNHGAGRPVLDRTGLTRFYDFEVEWVRDDLASAAGDGRPGPSVFTAMQELGLKLEPASAPFDIIVIEHAEKPAAN